MADFRPNCLPLLIGSLPLDDHQQATSLIFAYTPDIPIWPQLPVYKQEGMVQQFMPGLPGITARGGKIFIDTQSPSFEEEVLAFYEEYLQVTEGALPLETSRFQLGRDVAAGFFTFCDTVKVKGANVVALKGQLSGPITFCTGLADENGRAIFYNEQLRDIAVKHLALKARWQARKMRELGHLPIVFFDEPGLAGLGSSAFITIANEDIQSCFAESFTGVAEEQGLTGIHVCANTEWPVVLSSGVNIVSYDAYGFFDKLVLYGPELAVFINGGGMLATGIVPTFPEYIDKENVDSLTSLWLEQTKQLRSLGISAKQIYEQTFITPSCGTGAVTREQACRVMALTKGVSEKIRALGS